MISLWCPCVSMFLCVFIYLCFHGFCLFCLVLLGVPCFFVCFFVFVSFCLSLLVFACFYNLRLVLGCLPMKLLMICLWIQNDFFMIFHDFLMISFWFPYGFLLISFWFPFDFRVFSFTRFPKDFLEISLGFS